MINSITTSLRSLLAAPLREEPGAGWRPGLVRWLLAGALLVGLLSLAPATAASWGLGPTLVLSIVYLLLSTVVVLFAGYRLQLVGLLLIVYALGVADLLNSGNPAGAIFYFVVFIGFATLIWSLLAGAVAAGATLLTLGLTGVLLQFGMRNFAGALTMPAPPGDWVRAVVAVLLAGIAIIAAFQQLQREFARTAQAEVEALTEVEKQRATLEQSVEARTLQWRAVLEVGRAASGIHDPEELTEAVVNLISDRFGYYYAAIFLVNEVGDRAELKSATGEAGRVLKENQHSLPVGGRSMVGTAITGRQPRVALDTDAEAVRFANPLLPYTRSEIAVPLIVGDRVIGALDVQSTSPGAFGPAEIDTLQGMANQVAIAFENARLFQASRGTLDELRAVQRQYVVRAWQPLSGREDMEYSLGDDELSPHAAEMDVPLALRDQIIGGINISSETDWTPEQRSLVEAVATQAALALENARLVEATQSSAQRERVLAEITGKVWSSPTREGILRTAIGELGSALGADRAVIELTSEDTNE